MAARKPSRKKPAPRSAKRKPKSDIIEESTEGDGGPTGSGGVAAQSASPGDAPRQRRRGR